MLEVERLDLGACGTMVLPAARTYLERAHERGELPGGAPIHAFGNAIQQTGAVGVPASGRIDDAVDLDARDLQSLALRVNLGPRAAMGHNQRFHPFRQICDRFTRALFQHFALVGIDRDIACKFHEVEQLGAGEHGQPLAGIEHERYALFFQFARMLQHALAPIGRNDGEPDVARRGYAIQMRMTHRPRMKGGYLIVVKIRRDEGLCSVSAGDFAHVRARDAERVQPSVIGFCILAHGGHDERLAAQHAQTVGDVGGTAAEFAPQSGYQEGDVEHVDLVGQNVLAEPPLEHHDVVVGDRT